MKTNKTQPFRNKKVLIFGLGLLGGGVATANWFIKQGAKVTITDLKNAKQLAPSIKQLKGKYKLALGKHKVSDIKTADIVVLNPGVPANHPLLKKAKQVVNEATIFYNSFPGKIVGVTGTRGKTTTANWIAHLIGKEVILAGNNPEHAFLKAIEAKAANEASEAVTEMSSFSLELFTPETRKPDIAVITNIYQDHFNRYKNYRDYVATKANLFINQKADQHVILNYDNSWTSHLLSLPHKSNEWFFSLTKLPEKFDGLHYENGRGYFLGKPVLELAKFSATWGNHNVENLLAAALAAHLSGVSWTDIQSKLSTMPNVPFRQEVVFQNNHLTIINDTTATSPEGTIAAVKRFGSPTTVLITGGTDRMLEYKTWAKIILNYIVPEHIVLLDGSATKKMLHALNKKLHTYPTLKICLEAALAMGPHVILFSPGSKSFEKFTNEYDRGEQFNALVKRLIK
ncbi:MAG: UDP-N-acetylmuramoyl-L-alanine--D-glutamate ligase [Patescibacteria group bacterium]